MMFPGGSVSLPSELLASGRSGSAQVELPEKPVSLSRMSDDALFRFAEDMATLLATEDRDGVDSRLADYIDLLCVQVEREVMRRMF
jgi:hypothetical protein